MEPQQQFTEVKGKFPKFVTSEIPPRGIKTLKTLEMQEVSVQSSIVDLTTLLVKLIPTGIFNPSHKL